MEGNREIQELAGKSAPFKVTSFSIQKFCRQWRLVDRIRRLDHKKNMDSSDMEISSQAASNSDMDISPEAVSNHSKDNSAAHSKSKYDSPEQVRHPVPPMDFSPMAQNENFMSPVVRSGQGLPPQSPRSAGRTPRSASARGKRPSLFSPDIEVVWQRVGEIGDPIMTSSPITRHVRSRVLGGAHSPRRPSPLVFSPRNFSPIVDDLRSPGLDGDGSVLKHQLWNESSVVSDLNATPTTQLSSQFKKLNLVDSPKSEASPRINGHQANASIVDLVSPPQQNGYKSRNDLDSSSGTSDSSNSLDISQPGQRIFKANRSLRHLEDSILEEKSFDSLHDERYLPAVARPPVQKQPVVRQLPADFKFYYPQGKPAAQNDNNNALRRVCDVFKTFKGQQCGFDQMGEVCVAAGIPIYWKRPIFDTLTKTGERQSASVTDFTAWWRAMTSVAHDEAARFVYALTGGSGSKLTRKHFEPLVMDVIHTHPGLNFYRSATEFHDKYCDVVISRIFWNANRAWAPHLTASDVRRSDLLERIRDLEQEEDINKNLRYFSYEHFYVVYCNFWEVDTDHNMLISRDDLERHAKGAIPRPIVERIFSGAVCSRRGPIEFLNISEFTNFLLADEDKQHPMSIAYWFRILDVDGDGIINLYDMESFHEVIQDKLAAEGIETMRFNDVACNLIDAVRPEEQHLFRLKDLRGSRMAGKFFNSFVNWRKFYVQETTEASDVSRLEDESGQELTDWDRFCAEEYESLMDSASQTDDCENFDLNLDEDDDVHSASYHELL